MSVDNQGYFLIGDNLDDIDFVNFPKYSEFEELGEEDDISEFYYYEGDDLLELRLDWKLSEPSGYNNCELFGYWLNSPSYGISDFDFIDFVSDLGVIKREWKRWTLKRPRIFVLNIQS